MKKGITLTLTVLILLTLASCGQKAEVTTPVTTVPEVTEAPVPTVTTEPTETTIPAPTEPEWEPATVRAGRGEAVYRTFEAGTQLQVIGKFQNYYVVEQEDVNLLVSTEMLRMDTEEVFESTTGYARFGMEVFDNPYLRGEPTLTLPMNTQVAVLESKDYWACIEWNGGKGYAKADMVSPWQISAGSGSGSGGSDFGGYNDGTDVPIGSLTSADHSFRPQIHLLGTYYGPEMEADFETGKAAVLADGTEGYICLLERGDEVKVTKYDETYATIWLAEEQFVQIPRWLLKLEGDADYEVWTGYSRWNGIIYENYQMTIEMAKLSTNKQVTILDEVNGCYMVEYEGHIGYMKPDNISNTLIVSKPENGDSDASGSTWTPPKL